MTIRGLQNVSSITNRRYRFGRYDRITIKGAHYRVVKKEEDKHLLQLVSGNIVEPHFQPITDLEITELARRKAFRVEEAFYSKAHAELLMRHDDSVLLSLSEEELRDIDWKVEWCKRFDAARIDPRYAIKVVLTPESLRDFIQFERDRMDRWYLSKYGVRRRAGRMVVPERVAKDATGLDIKEQKAFDYPSPSALRGWITIYRNSGYRREAFRPRYKNCGNRQQLPSSVEEILNRGVEGYKNWRRPKKADIFENVDGELDRVSTTRVGSPLKVSRTTVYNRINKLNPFEVESAREGPDKAQRRYSMVGWGKNKEITRPLERVEMDDWEADLFVLATTTTAWKEMSKKDRAKVPRIRCTITVAIDCLTRAIVGLNVSPFAPSTPGTKATIATILDDKSALAAFGEAGHDWPMSGRPEVIATDGGPVFNNDEVGRTLTTCMIGHELPEDDPRKRGTVEAFFRYLKRVCRYFAGQTFKDVVEKGDYPAEEMASVAFEDFHKRVIRFIVDKYHHRRHRGLEYQTPSGVWQRTTEVADMPMPPTSAQKLVAFGHVARADATLDKHGLQFQGISYTSEALGRLMRLTGYGAPMPIVVNPFDIGSILVQVEERHRAQMNAQYSMEMYHDFLEVGSMPPEFRGVRLDDKLAASAEVRKLAKSDEEYGWVFRQEAHRRLYEEGQKTMDAAGVRSHHITQKQFDQITQTIDFNSEAGLKGAPRGAARQGLNEHSGTMIGAPTITRVMTSQPSSQASVAAHRTSLAETPAPDAPLVPPPLPTTTDFAAEFLRSANMEGEEE